MLGMLVAARLLAMPGWMPVLSKDSITVTLCAETGGGTVDIAFDREHPKPSPDKDSGHCLFAASDHGASAPPAFASVSPLRWALSSAYRPPAIIAGVIASQAPPPPSTGPPLV